MRRRHLLMALITSGLLALGNSHAAAAQLSDAELKEFNNIHVSIARLIAHPQRYHGKQVAVIGYVRIADGTPVIYLSKDDGQFSIPKNGLRIQTNGAKLKSKFEKQYCLLVGEFRADTYDKNNIYSGTIGKLSQLTIWQSDSDDSNQFKKNQLRNVIFSRSRY